MNKSGLIPINQALVDALQPSDRAVYLASKDRRVAEYDSVSLGKALQNALTWIAKDIGLRNISEEDMHYLVIRIAEILKRYYREFSIRDFRMAFEMALVGELDDFLPRGKEDRNHYNNLNAEFVCKILNAYRGRRLGVLKKVQAEPKAPELSEAKTKELDERAKRQLKEAYLRFCSTGDMSITRIQEIVFYGILADAGLVRPVEVSDAEKRAVLGYMLNEMAMRGASRGEIYRQKQRGITASEVQSQAFVNVRRRMIQEAFEEMKNKQINIEDYVKC